MHHLSMVCCGTIDIFVRLNIMKTIVLIQMLFKTLIFSTKMYFYLKFQSNAIFDQFKFKSNRLKKIHGFFQCKWIQIYTRVSTNCKYNRKMLCKQKCSQIRQHMNQIHKTQLKTHLKHRNRNKCPKSPPRGMGVITVICANNTKLSKHFKFYSTMTMLIKCIFEKISWEKSDLIGNQTNQIDSDS